MPGAATDPMPAGWTFDPLRYLRVPPSPRGVVVVTGGSAGLGRAVVREFAAAGYDVAVLARGRDGLTGAVADIAAAGHRGLGVSCDVAVHTEVEAAADEIETILGPIGVWVNNATASVVGPFLETDPENFEWVTRVTYVGVVNGTRAALRRMKTRDRGVVVQVSSARTLRGSSRRAATQGAAHAVVGFTASVTAELVHNRSAARVVVVDLPAMNTKSRGVRSHLPHPPQPVPPMHQPEVGARTVRHAAEHRRRTRWVGPHTAGTVFGNRTMAPLLGRPLRGIGHQAQPTSADDTPDLGFALGAPTNGDYGAHAGVDRKPLGHRPALWVSEHRAAAAAARAATAALGRAVALLRRAP